MVAIIAISFVAGSFVTGTSAFASGDKNGKPFEEIWEAIHSLEAEMDDFEGDLEEIVYEADEETGMTKTYVKTAGPFKQVFCDIGDYATSGGAIGEGFGRPLNTAGEIAKNGDTVTGWENTNGGTSFVVCVDLT